MKTLKINKSILLIIGLLVFNSCIQDDDFDTPDISIVEPNIPENAKIQISALAGDLAQEQGNGVLDYTNEETIVSYIFNDNDLFVEGYVVSSDEGGNFFEEIIIQDNFENPSIGIKLLIDVNPLFVRYQPGRKVYVKLNGLSVGITNGVLTLGILNGNEVDKIPSASENDVILRSTSTKTLVPMPMPFEDFADDKTNLFIQLQDVQFNRNQATGDTAQTYASEPSDQFDGERNLESCASQTSVVFSTSTFADFKGLTLPSGRGNIDAILTKDFFGEVFNVVVNSPEDVNLNNQDRCDPAEFIISNNSVDCDDTFPTGNTTVFSDDFESYNNQGELLAAGWTVINLNGGSYTWGIDAFGGNTYAIGNAFNTDEANIDTWLISPVIDLSSTIDNILNFDIQTNFDGGEVMSVYVSTDFVDITTDSNWSLLEDVTIPSGPSGTFGSFQVAGPVNLDCISDETVRLGFRYTGSDPGITTRYHVDEIVVTGN